MAFVEQGSQLIANKAIGEAVSSTSNTTGFALFHVAATRKSKYITSKDSHINIGKASYMDIDIGWVSLAAGIAKGFETNNCKITAGGFWEHGHSEYKSLDTITTVEDIKKDVRATGMPHYDGGGLLGRQREIERCVHQMPHYDGGGLLGRVDFDNNFYTEISVRVGNARSSFHSKDMEFDHKSTSYDYNKVYLGTHIGGGYNYEITDKLSLDTSGRYFFTHQGDKDITFPTNETIKFAGISSHKIRLGPKVIYKATEELSPYLGATFEYEFAGKQNATFAGFDVNAPTLKGTGTIEELGVKWNVSGFLMDLSLRGYVGNRVGIDGMLKLKYTFGKQKKVSPPPAPRVPYVDPKLNNIDSPQKASSSLLKSKETAVDGTTNVQPSPKGVVVDKEIVIDGITYVQSKPKEVVVDGVTYIQKTSSPKEVVVNRVTYIKEESSSKPKKQPYKSSRTGERVHGLPILHNQFSGR